ncbi:MAG: L,D-transpeptidase family protein [Pseudolabrys sp.]
MRSTIRIVALTSCAVLSAGAARAQTPMQFWHQEWSRQRDASVQQDQGYYPYYQSRGSQQRGWFGGGGFDNSYDPEPDPARSRGPMPQVHVDNPTFYDYKPDTLKTVALATICKPQLSPAAQAAQATLKPQKVSETTGAAPAEAPADAAPADAAPAPSPFAQACAADTQSVRVLPEVGKALTAWYGAHPQFVWSDGKEVSAKALAAMATLAASDKVGLVPADYRVDPPALDGLDDAARQAALADFDVRLSARTITYVLDATRGRIDPDRISGYHDLPRKSVDLAAAMDALTSKDDVTQYLQAQNPDNAQFRALVAELARLREGKPAQQAKLSDDIRIVPGESNPQLGAVLAAIGESAPDLKQKYPDVFSDTSETYDRRAVALVKAFQRGKGVHADGVIGRNTIRALTGKHDDTAGRIAKIQIALEQLRWLPRNFGDRYVFLNQPAFEVSYFNGTEKPLTMRAVVGRPDAQTYFFVDHIKDVQFNPYWNLPRSIVVNEMLPKLYRDGSYLDDHGYEVLNQRGRQIASNSVNWAAYAKNATSVEVRQPPGQRNALGLLKIEFPNKHAIYMHDTPQKSFFARDMRALSHGCVRLQNPQAMAAAVLGKSVDYVNKQIARGENASERVGDVPVYLAYFTAWPDQSGTVHYYGDIYDRDAHMKTAFEKTEAARKGG